MSVKIANRVRFWIVSAVTAVMVYALFVSASHIVHVAQTIGVPGWQAQTSWILVDLPALIGKVLQIKVPRHGYVFVASTRKAGRGLTYFSGSLSLACNVASGLILGSWGAAGWGAFVVMMFLVLETVATRIKIATGASRNKSTDNGQTTSTTPARRRCPKGCTCGRHNRKRTPKAPPAVMPVSPVVGPVGAYAGRKA